MGSENDGVFCEPMRAELSPADDDALSLVVTNEDHAVVLVRFYCKLGEALCPYCVLRRDFIWRPQATIQAVVEKALQTVPECSMKDIVEVEARFEVASCSKESTEHDFFSGLSGVVDLIASIRWNQAEFPSAPRLSVLATFTPCWWSKRFTYSSVSIHIPEQPSDISHGSPRWIHVWTAPMPFRHKR